MSKYPYNRKCTSSVDKINKMAKIDTVFMTKTAQKPYPLGPHIPILLI